MNSTLIFLFFILLSSFFSGAETAFTAINRIKLRSLIEQKEKKVFYIEFLLKSPKKLLTCILIGNNLANIAATTFATAFFINLFKTFGITNIATSLTLITIIVTFILLIFGEISPKTLAMKNPTKWALRISPIIYYFYICLYPIVILFDTLSTLISKLLRIKPTQNQHLTEDEIKLLIQLGQEDGILEKEEQKMLHGVINVFDKVVREIMTPRTDMICIEITDSVSNVIHLITNKGHSRIPVYEDKIDNIIGFIYAKDLLNVNPSIKTHNLRSFMRNAIFIPETKLIESLLQQMRKSKFHLAIVVDEHGGVSGLVTMEDIIEEIVGEIQDEYDKENIFIKKIKPNYLIVNAKTNLDELSTYLDFTFPKKDDYDTIAGFILYELGSFPKKNQSIVYDRFEFIVKEIKNRRIISFDVKIKESDNNDQKTI